MKKNNIKKIIILLMIFTGSCNLVESPEFKGIEKVYIDYNNEGKAQLIANARFYNPNLLGGTFSLEEIQVFVDDKHIGNLSSEIYKVPSKKDFVIPLIISFKKENFQKKSVLDILNSLMNNKLKINYKGKINYKMGKIKVPYKVNYEQEIKIFEDNNGN